MSILERPQLLSVQRVIVSQQNPRQANVLSGLPSSPYIPAGMVMWIVGDWTKAEPAPRFYPQDRPFLALFALTFLSSVIYVQKLLNMHTANASEEFQMKLPGVIWVRTELVWLPLILVCIAFRPYLAPCSLKALPCLMPGDDYCWAWKADTSWVEQSRAKPNQGLGQQTFCQVSVSLIYDESFSNICTVVMCVNPLRCSREAL